MSKQDVPSGEFVRLLRNAKPLQVDNDSGHPFVVIADGEICGFYANFKEAEYASRAFRYNPSVIDVLIAEVKMHNEVLYGRT